MSTVLLLGFILVAVAGSAFFSGSEIALISCNRLRIHNLVREGSRRARIVERLLEDRRRAVTTVLLGTNFCNVGAASAATGLFALLLPGKAAILSTALITPIILVFGEILPKTLFRHHADVLCLRAAPLLSLLHRLLMPLVLLFDGAASLLFRLLGAPEHREDAYVTKEELKLLVSEGERLGLLRADGGQMISRAFRFSETRVKNVTVPLVDVFALEEHTPLSDALSLIAERQHSRIPVYRDRVDNIIGLLYTFDLLDVTADVTVGDLMHPAYYVPESKGLQELLLEMKQSRIHMAIVVDEFGGASGIVSLEDALEKIVGVIRDEFDRPQAPITRSADEWVMLDARMTLTEARRRAGIDLPEGEYETVGGYLTWVLGRIPEAGELISHGDWDFEVLEATARRIRRIRVRQDRDGDRVIGS